MTRNTSEAVAAVLFVGGLLLTLAATARGESINDEVTARIESGAYDSLMTVKAEPKSKGLSRGTVYAVVGAAHLADFASTEVALDAGYHETNTWAPWSLQQREGRVAASVVGTVVVGEGVMLINRESSDAAKVALWIAATVKLFVAGHNVNLAWD